MTVLRSWRIVRRVAGGGGGLRRGFGFALRLVTLERWRGPDLRRMPEAKEHDQASHRYHRSHHVDQPRAVVVRNQELRDREAHPGDQDRRPDFLHSFEAGKRPDQPERHQDGEERQLTADHRRQVQQIEARDCGKRDDRRAERAVGNRCSVGDQRQAGRGERRETEPNENCRGDGHRSAEARGAFKERAEAERDQQQLQAAIRRDVGDRVPKYLERTALFGQPVQEDDVENDPADRQESEQRAIDGSHPCHFRRHPVGEDRDDQCGDQPEYRGPVRLDMQERETPQHDHDGNRRHQRGQQDAVEGVVDLTPDHCRLLPGWCGHQPGPTPLRTRAVVQ